MQAALGYEIGWSTFRRYAVEARDSALAPAAEQDARETTDPCPSIQAGSAGQEDQLEVAAAATAQLHKEEQRPAVRQRREFRVQAGYVSLEEDAAGRWRLHVALEYADRGLAMLHYKHLEAEVADA